MQFLVGILFLFPSLWDANVFSVDAQITSFFGSGYCFTNQSLYIVERVGLQMCLTVCVSSSQCLSVDHNVNTLQCFLYDMDSEDNSDYKTEPYCTHYSKHIFTPDLRYHCTGSECLSYETCVKLSNGIHHCVKTECSTPHVSYSLLSTGIDTVGSSKSVTCDSGYELENGMTSQVITCRSNGNWNGTSVCNLPGSDESYGQKQDCNSLYRQCKQFQNNQWRYKGNGGSQTPLAKQCHAFCDNLGGVPNSLKTDAGKGKVKPKLLPECAEPTTPANATILPGNNTVGSTRVVECDTGFAQIGGSSTIECLVSQQTWSVWTGSCEVCGEPESIQHSVISEGDRTVGSIRTYTCITGYEGNGESPNITCDENAVWTSSLFSCSLVDCGSPPSIASMTYTSTGSTWLSTAEYSCNYGFVVSGNGTIVCSSSGEWSSTVINCTEPSSAIFDFEGDDLYNLVGAGSILYKSFDSQTGGTSSTDTGPTGAYHGTKYRYFEGTGPEQNDVARMESDIYFSAGVQCIDFFYSMYGEDIGTMRIKYQGYGSSSETLLWSDSGDKQEPTWFNANVTVNATEKFKLIVEATKGGSSYASDAAIDYIRLFDYAC